MTQARPHHEEGRARYRGGREGICPAVRWVTRVLGTSPNTGGGRRMDPEPVVVQEGTPEWETRPDEEVGQKGSVYWRTLIRVIM